MRALVVMALSGCAAAPAWKTAPHDRVYQDVGPLIEHAVPARRPEVREWWHAVSRGVVEPLANLVSPGAWIEGPEALDVNHFGQVIGSPWFTPRLGAQQLSPEQIARGHAVNPPTPGPLRVLGGKLTGVTPGMLVEDPSGARFLVKFDPPAFPGLSSGAEVVVGRILHAAGWNVPENHLFDVRLDTLTLAPDATTRGDYGQEVPLTHEGLRALVSNVNPRLDGTVRALFSRIIPGEILGAGSFRERRHDDPNERLAPLERRSLRALGVFYAWLNDVDARDSTTLATWLPSASDPTRGHVEHHLIDFGDSLGAAASRAKLTGEGYEYRVDWAGMASQFFSLGWYYHYWLPARRAPFRSVGFFEAEVFEPARWRPGLPNPAFDAATRLDRYWAGSIIARITPDMLRAILAEAGYSEPGALAYLVDTLRVRQEKVLRWAFEPVLPLDEPQVHGERLTLVDLAALAGVVDGGLRGLSWEASADARVLGRGTIGDSRQIAIELTDVASRVRAGGGDPFFTVRIVDPKRPHVGVEVHLRVLSRGLLPVALERDAS